MKWEEHYNENTFELPEYALFDYIKSKSNLSIFAGMLQSTGYDTIINASQTFTVWAPTNDALAGVDAGNANLTLQIVKNHIARNRYTTSNVEALNVRMLSGKSVSMTRSNGGFLFGDKAMVEPDQPASNGLVHTISSYVPYMENIWEFIKRGENIDSLSKYLTSQTQSNFRADLSTEIGVNDDGNPVYDSIFVISNDVLDRYGNVQDEDTVFTMLLPDNNAWNKTYAKVNKLLNIPEAFGGEARRREITQLGVVKDIFFSGLIDKPNELDSVISTSYNVFYNPASLFNTGNTRKLSNGLVYITSQLNFPDTTWHREIKVEAENTRGRENENSNIFSRSNSGVGISQNRYILVEPTGTSNVALASVTFPIPNTFSAKYNMYCVFVPASISNENDLLPMRAKFSLTYINKTTGSTAKKTFVPTVDTTDPNNLTKLYIGQYDFEFANVLDADYPDILVSMEVISNVKVSEANQYNRSMRIDCIIFEPVVE